jgi:hypothetical protein
MQNRKTKVETVDLYLFDSKIFYTRISARVKDSELTIEQQDIGNVVEEHYGDSDIEFFIFLDKENTKLLMRSLNVATYQNLLNALKIKFSKRTAREDIKTYLTRKGVNYTTHVY